MVKPWLLEKFDLPEDLAVDPRFKSLMRMATWAAEKAKIDLSSREETVIGLSDAELLVRDLSNEEIYLDIELRRQTLDGLIGPKVDESIQAARETMDKAGLKPHDIERIVFVG